MNERDGRRLRGAFACRWDLCLPGCFCGWRSRRGRRWLLSLLLVVPGVWLRAYAAGYVRKNAELTQTGPYAYTRNPLYLGSMMIAFGFAVASGSWVIFVALAVFSGDLSADDPVEEAYLREHFAGFDEYCGKVPRLLPRLTAAQQR